MGDAHDGRRSAGRGGPAACLSSVCRLAVPSCLSALTMRYDVRLTHPVRCSQAGKAKKMICYGKLPRPSMAWVRAFKVLLFNMFIVKFRVNDDQMLKLDRSSRRSLQSRG